MTDHMRHHRQHEHLDSPFGNDAFGKNAEKFARFFGTPKFIVGQTLVVAAWIALNALVLIHHWDPYPFILLNLLFSTQAAYAAPLILLAQTRQADRDKASVDADAKHREEIAAAEDALLQQNTDLTRQTHALAVQIAAQAALLEEIHRHVSGLSPDDGQDTAGS